jgi:hypothetical protein
MTLSLRVATGLLAADAPIVIPAQAGIQGEVGTVALGPRFRGDDNRARLTMDSSFHAPGH